MARGDGTVTGLCMYLRPPLPLSAVATVCCVNLICCAGCVVRASMGRFLTQRRTHNAALAAGSRALFNITHYTYYTHYIHTYTAGARPSAGIYSFISRLVTGSVYVHYTRRSQTKRHIQVHEISLSATGEEDLTEELLPATRQGKGNRERRAQPHPGICVVRGSNRGALCTELEAARERRHWTLEGSGNCSCGGGTVCGGAGGVYESNERAVTVHNARRRWVLSPLAATPLHCAPQRHGVFSFCVARVPRAGSGCCSTRWPFAFRWLLRPS